MAWRRHTSLTNFTIQQSRSFEGVCVSLRLMNCLNPRPDSQPTATELSSRRCTDLEQSSAAYHICSVVYRQVNRSYLLTYPGVRRSHCNSCWQHRSDVVVNGEILYVLLMISLFFPTMYPICWHQLMGLPRRRCTNVSKTEIQYHGQGSKIFPIFFVLQCESKNFTPSIFFSTVENF